MADTTDYSKFSPFNMREGEWIQSLPEYDALAVGQSSMPRGEVGSASITVTSGTMRLRFFTSTRSETVTQSRTITGATAAATPTLCRVGLYSVADNGDLTLVTSVANDVTLWAATNTRYTRALTNSYDLEKGKRYAIGILYVGTTTPTFYGMGSLLSAESFEEPKMNAQVSGLSDLPSTIANASMAALTSGIYSAILP